MVKMAINGFDLTDWILSSLSKNETKCLQVNKGDIRELHLQQHLPYEQLHPCLMVKSHRNHINQL